MRMEGLRLTNFRSHEQTEILFDDVTICLGPNGAGKSSVADAIEFLLCGRNRYTDAAGRGRDQLARHGQGGFAVEARVDGIDLARRVSGASQTLTRDGHPVQEFVLGVSKDVLSAVLNAGRFLGLPEKEQKALLAHVLDSGAIEIPQEIRSLDKAVPHELRGVAEAEALHKLYYDERTIVGRQMKDMGEPADLNFPEGTPSPKMVEQRLAERRAEEKRLIAQRAQRTAASDAGQELRKKLESDKQRYAADVLDKATEERCIEASTQAEDIRNWKKQAAALDAEAQGVERTVAALLELRGKCPTCIRNISAAEQQTLGAKLKEESAELRGKQERLERKVARFEDPDRATERIGKHRTAAVEIDKIERRLGQMPEAGVDTADLDQQLADLAERIRKGEAQLAEAQGQLRAVREYDQAMERRKQLEAKHAACERLVEYFGPNGVRAQLAADRLPAFNDQLNSNLEEFGFGCAITFDPYKLIVTTPQGVTHQASQLSESEQFRFSVAFQVALALATGVNLVVVDRADVLDKAKRRQLNAMLLEAAKDGVQSLVLATSVDGPPQEVPEGVRFYELRNNDGRTFVAVDTGAEVAA